MGHGHDVVVSVGEYTKECCGVVWLFVFHKRGTLHTLKYNRIQQMKFQVKKIVFSQVPVRQAPGAHKVPSPKGRIPTLTPNN